MISITSVIFTYGITIILEKHGVSNIISKEVKTIRGGDFVKSSFDETDTIGSLVIGEISDSELEPGQTKGSPNIDEGVDLAASCSLRSVDREDFPDGITHVTVTE